MAIQRERSAQVGEGLTCASWRSFRADRFSCYRNYRWGDSSSILA